MSNDNNNTPAEMSSPEKVRQETYDGALKLGYTEAAATNIANIAERTLAASRTLAAKSALRGDYRGD
jgi:hypothetical protein